MAEVVVFVTVPSEKEGVFLGRTLVEQRLVACATLIPNVRSIFQWEGSISEEQECLLVLKSRTEVYDALEAAVKAHHSYDVPEIIALPILQGSAEYLSWIREMTKDKIR